MSPVRTFGADRGRKSALWAKYRPRSARFLRTRDATPLDPRRNASGPAGLQLLGEAGHVGAGQHTHQSVPPAGGEDGVPENDVGGAQARAVAGAPMAGTEAGRHLDSLRREALGQSQAYQF